MIEPLAPSLTKNVPMIEVTMQARADGERIEHQRARIGWPAKKIAASTIVATTVTA